MVVSNPLRTRAIADAKIKTDKVDAGVLAQLLPADYLPGVWQPDDAIRMLRRLVARRAHIVRQRTRLKNQIHAILLRNLVTGCPASDPFGNRSATAKSTPGTVIKRRTSSRPLAAAAQALVAAIGDIQRFPSPQRPVSYFGLDPRVRQSGGQPARTGLHITKVGPAHARGMLVEAAWAVARTPGPLHAFFDRVRARRGPQIAAVALARKLAVLTWHLLTRGQDLAIWRHVVGATSRRRSGHLEPHAPTTATTPALDNRS